jgi:flagellar biosynthesis protein FlhB
MAEESDLEKTEQPSQRRLEKAREEGQVARSREWVTFALLATAMGGLWLTADLLESRLGFALQRGVGFDRAIAFDTSRMLANAQALSLQGLIAIAPLFAMVTVAALMAPMALGGLLFAPNSLAPDFAKLNPMAGLGRIFSAQSLAELFKALAKSVLIGYVAWLVISRSLDAIMGLVREPVSTALPHMLSIVARSCAWIVGALLLIALIDVPYQIWALHRKLRMSREDLKQEHKEAEGNPQIKARIRRMQKALATRRMMAEVPKADVVVTNPTHFAVALRYVEGHMGAPRVIAKGSDLVAQRIRDIARSNGVEVVDAPALARSLFKHAELGREIPAGLYTAVARLLAWAYQLRRWRTDGGLQPALPTELPVPQELQYAGGPA